MTVTTPGPRRSSASSGCGLTTSWMPRSANAETSGATSETPTWAPPSDQARSTPVAAVARKVGIHSTKSPVIPRADNEESEAGRHSWSVRGLPVTSNREVGISNAAALRSPKVRVPETR